MSCFKTHIATATATEPDPAKHVNYQLGMVLGVDDFNQEFAYLAGRDQWLARDLIGYGTARGLRVRTETETGGPRLVVEPGVALNLSGQLICVSAAQCAHLNQWLAANQTKVAEALSSPPSNTLNLYVTLCYRECPTDDVPIPGEPCRSEDELTAPSRITDDFQLELRFAPPLQREEDALRDFADWLKRMDVTDAVVNSTPLDQFVQAIRAAAQPWLSPGSPPSSPPADYMFGSPPASIRVRPADVCEYLRTAFRLWVTELRPLWVGRGQGCAPDLRGEQPDEDCLLLAEVRVPVLAASPGGFLVDDTRQVTINESRRPYAVHLRMLQEWLLCGRHLASNASGPPPGGTVVSETAFGQAALAGTSLAYSRADHTHGTPALSPGNSVVSGTVFGQGATAGASMAYSRADHSHGTPTLPALSGDVTGPVANTLVNRLLGVNLDVAPPAPALNQVLTVVNVGGNLRWRAANASTPPAVTLDGDVTGAANATSVARIRGIEVEATAPANGQILTAVQVGSALRWRPAAPPVVSGSFVRADFTASGIRDYAIVAAGLIRTNGTSSGLVYNGLTAKLTPASEVLIGFNGYRQPEPTSPRHQYIVKAMLGFHEGLRAPNVVFRSFQPDGIVLRVTDSGVIPPNFIGQVELMIEVSQYFA